jgi:hypothetical protein
MAVVPAFRGFAVRHRGVLVAAGLLALTLAIYLPYAVKGGWYYDDWKLYAMQASNRPGAAG